jgi:hypothetical protein
MAIRDRAKPGNADSGFVMGRGESGMKIPAVDGTVIQEIFVYLFNSI